MVVHVIHHGDSRMMLRIGGWIAEGICVCCVGQAVIFNLANVSNCQRKFMPTFVSYCCWNCCCCSFASWCLPNIDQYQPSATIANHHLTITNHQSITMKNYRWWIGACYCCLLSHIRHQACLTCWLIAIPCRRSTCAAAVGPSMTGCGRDQYSHVVD